jgi:3-hydroxyisobutyrate dehydrogenase
MADIIFIGTGAIGLPMALRLQQAGHDVAGVEASSERRAQVLDAGLATVHGSIDDAGPAPIVIVMVATPQQLDALLDAAIPHGVAGQNWVIMSTVGAAAVERAASRLTDAGAVCVDAPVTGGAARALAGTLGIFVSGADAAVVPVLPLLAVMGSPVVVGDRVGVGQNFKVVNQHLCSIHIVAAAEALELAASMGVDTDLALELLGGGAAASWMLADRGPRMLHPEERVYSTIDIFVKDSGLVADAAAAAGAEVPVLEAARARFLQASAAGQGRQDDSTVNLTYRH